MSHVFKTLTVTCEHAAVEHAVRLLRPFQEMIQRKDFHGPAHDRPGELAIMLDLTGIPVGRVEEQIDIIALALEPAGCQRIRRSTASMRAVREDT